MPEKVLSKSVQWFQRQTDRNTKICNFDILVCIDTSILFICIDTIICIVVVGETNNLKFKIDTSMTSIHVRYAILVNEFKAVSSY